MVDARHSERLSHHYLERAAITFATPGSPTPEERPRYALAVQRATTPAPLSPEQEADQTARLRRRRQMLAEVGVYAND